MSEHMEKSSGMLRLVTQPETTGDQAAIAQTARITGTDNERLALSCREICSMVANEQAEICFQPIVDLRTGEIFAYEALSRGAAGGSLYMPSEMFAAAQCCNLQNELDVMCCNLSYRTALRNGLTKPVFINVDAQHIEECRSRIDITPDMLDGQPGGEKVILEITERQLESPILAQERNFTLSVDGVGLGYLFPATLAKVRPEFIKIDRSLIRNLAALSYHGALLSAMVDYGHSIGAQIIAVGVETQQELKLVAQSGVDYAQGFLLAPPSLQPDVAVDGLAGHLEATRRGDPAAKKLSELYGVTIGDIAQITPVVTPDTIVSEIQALLTGGRGQGVVVVDGQKPVGLVMGNSLYYHLGSHYGVSLYYRRPVERVMDNRPLIVEAGLSLEAVATMAMARTEDKLYDLIIVIKEGNLLGTVSIIHLLKHLTNLQIRSAANSNPLTGLPGNLLIEEKLKSVVEDQTPFAVLYIDLDNFKAFNDKYGFEHGDKVLLLTAGLLNSCIASYSDRTPEFLGHVGGDDFLIITQPDKASDLCRTIVAKFDEAICGMYPPDDLKNGYIVVPDRRGNIDKFPIMTVSIAVVDNVARNFNNYLEIGEVAAQMKKRAKQIVGSAWVDERRKQAMV